MAGGEVVNGVTPTPGPISPVATDPAAVATSGNKITAVGSAFFIPTATHVSVQPALFLTPLQMGLTALIAVCL